MDQQRRTTLIRWFLKNYVSWKFSFENSLETLNYRNSVGELDALEVAFLKDVLAEVSAIVKSYLVTEEPDKTDIWRENLKLWAIAHHRQSKMLFDNFGYKYLPMEKSDPENKSHYKGEF